MDMTWTTTSAVIPAHYTLEGDLVDDIREYCSVNNIYCQRLYSDSGTAFGASDFLMLVEGKPYFIELKRALGKQRKGQKHFEKHVKLAGAQYHIVRSVDELRQIISVSK